MLSRPSRASVESAEVVVVVEEEEDDDDDTAGDEASVPVCVGVGVAVAS